MIFTFSFPQTFFAVNANKSALSFFPEAVRKGGMRSPQAKFSHSSSWPVAMLWLMGWSLPSLLPWLWFPTVMPVLSAAIMQHMVSWLQATPLSATLHLCSILWAQFQLCSWAGPSLPVAGHCLVPSPRRSEAQWWVCGILATRPPGRALADAK